MLVMVSLAFHLFVGTVTVFVLGSYGCNKCSQCSRPLIQVVADSILLGCCDLVVFFHRMFAGRPPFAFFRWFQVFCLFHLVSAVCLPD